MFQLDTTTRAGRMLEAGRVTVTFRSARTGEHITIQAKARKPRDNGRGWETCKLSEARVVFFEVPNAEGGWNDRVAKFTARNGLVSFANADPARVWCAKQLVRLVAGQPLPGGLEALEEERCGRCGRALTDPVSIQRGIGPECYGQLTGSKHEAKNHEIEAEQAAVIAAERDAENAVQLDRDAVAAGNPLPEDLDEQWAELGAAQSVYAAADEWLHAKQEAARTGDPADRVGEAARWLADVLREGTPRTVEAAREAFTRWSHEHDAELQAVSR